MPKPSRRTGGAAAAATAAAIHTASATDAAETLIVRTGTQPTTIVKPVDNAIRILRYLSVIRRPATVTAIARELKINPSTCFNILRTLAWNGVIDFDDQSKSYRTGLGAIDLANRALLGQVDIGPLVAPELERIAQRWAVTTMIWRRIGEDRMMLVAIADSSAAVRINLRLGQRLPLLIGASGRVMAAFGGLTDAEIRRRVARLKWSRPVSPSAYIAQVHRARADGWALDDGNYVSGMCTVAAPIFNTSGALRGVVAAAMFRGQHERTAMRRIVEEVRALALGISTGNLRGGAQRGPEQRSVDQRGPMRNAPSRRIVSPLR